MILHLSQALAKRLKCKLSFSDAKINQTGRTDSWSADIFRIPRMGSHILVMHDASLWPLIFEAQRFKTYEQFLETLLLHIESSYFRFGASFDGSNITVVATKRSNRSIIGSMNNAIMLIVSYVEQSIEEGEPMDGIELQERIARTPFMALEDIFPDKAFARIAAQQR